MQIMTREEIDRTGAQTRLNCFIRVSRNSRGAITAVMIGAPTNISHGSLPVRWPEHVVLLNGSADSLS